jgi:hypothetical protein
MQSIKLACSILLLIISLTVMAVNPPQNVIKAFQTQFPDAQNIKWEKENAHAYEAEFTANSTKMSVSYDETGKWLETETAIKAEQLPATVVAAFQKQYPDKKISGADKIINNKGETTYEIEYKNGMLMKEVVYTAEGVLAK